MTPAISCWAYIQRIRLHLALARHDFVNVTRTDDRSIAVVAKRCETCISEISTGTQACGGRAKTEVRVVQRRGDLKLPSHG